jgi:aryl-alcohol dehydrogenase-like predicted oxidoreductase
MSNVASRFMLDQPAVGGIIIGARLGVSEHLFDNLRIFELVLTDSDREEISASLATLTPIPATAAMSTASPHT